MAIYSWVGESRWYQENYIRQENYPTISFSVSKSNNAAQKQWKLHVMSFSPVCICGHKRVIGFKEGTSRFFKDLPELLLNQFPTLDCVS